MGAAFLKAVLAVTPTMLVLEVLPHFLALAWLNDTTAAGNLRQLPLLLGGMMIYAGVTALAFYTAASAYERVDL